MKKKIKKILQYFLEGLILTMPLVLTIWIIIQIIQWLDGIIPVNIPGLGLIILFISISFLGFIATSLITKPLFYITDRIASRIPGVKLIYTSIKDLIQVFFSDNGGFNQPVLVTLNREFQIQKLGFITQDDLNDFGINDKVAVYLPHSYNFSGNLFIVPSENVENIDVPSSNVMKFIVSGGISGLEGMASETKSE